MDAVIATHTIASDVVCARSGGCDADPLTVALSIGAGVLLMISFLRSKSKLVP